MSDYDNTNQGALFENRNRQSDRSPDYKGTLNVDGTEYWVSAWVKTSRKGEDYISMSVTPKEEQTAPARNANPGRTIGKPRPAGKYDSNMEEGRGPAFPSEASGMDDVPF